MSKSIRDAEASVGRTTLNLGPNHKKHLNSKRSIYAIRIFKLENDLPKIIFK